MYANLKYIVFTYNYNMIILYNYNMIILYYVSDIISMSLHGHPFLWLFEMKKFTGVLLTCLEEKQVRANCLPWQSTAATLFSNFHHEIAFMESSSRGGGEG